MIETPILFGAQSNLFGVITQPAGGPSTSLAFLTFNAGVIPRIGPHRLNVKLARALALEGETSLRFDLAGQGDSRSVHSQGDYMSQAMSDLRSAMDHLQHRHGIRRFALIGICSGAASGLAMAVADPRIVGVLMYDGYWYRSRWTRLVRHWKRLRTSSPSNILAGLKRLAGKLFASRANAAGPVGIYGDSSNLPRAQFIESVQALADRKVATFFIYGGSVIEYYSYGNQFRDVFGREKFFDKVRCDFHPDLDHTLISLAAQRRMIEIIKGWVPEVHQARDAA